MTNAEKLAKEMLDNPEYFAEILIGGVCERHPGCSYCPLYQVSCGNKNEIEEWLKSEVGAEELAIWKYDNFPYMKIGKVKHKNEDGTVEINGYDGMCFEPMKIIPYDETLITKFNTILEEHHKAEKEADKRTLRNLRTLFGFESDEGGI